MVANDCCPDIPEYPQDNQIHEIEPLIIFHLLLRFCCDAQTLPVKLRSEKVIIPNWQPIEVGNLEFLLHMLLSSSPAALFYTGYDCEEAGSGSRSSADVVVVSAL